MSSLTVLATYTLLALAYAGGSRPLKKPEAELLFPAGPDGEIPSKRCLNFGSPDTAVGPFLGEASYIQWVRTPSRILQRKHREIAGTEYRNAFNTQRHEKNIVFFTHVDPAYRYKVSFGFAEILGYRCVAGNRVMTIEAMSESKSGIDVFSTVGCNAAHWEELNNVRPYRNGNIRVKLSGQSGFATLATICFEPTGPRDNPSPSPIPMESSAPTPTPTIAVTPTSTPTATPTASPSAMESIAPTPTPTPTMTATATPTATPTASPSSSPSPVPLTVPSTCTQNGCTNLRGRADYKVIGNSLSRDEDRQDCGLRSSAAAPLSLPSGARIVKAILYWSASGSAPSSPSAKLDGKLVSATEKYTHAEPYGSGHIHFYGAEADVTAAVAAKGAGSYSVSDIPALASGAVCTANAAYAAWSLVVVYEAASLPVAQVNVCTDNFKFTFPEGAYSSRVNCLGEGKQSRTTVVTFESDDYKGEYFYINGGYRGDNLFKGASAPNLDIHTFDVSQLAMNKVGGLTYTFVSYVTESVWGKAVEGLFFPVRVTHTVL